METQERPVAVPELKFYYASHKLENLEKFIREADNYDVLFVEGVGGSKEYRMNLENDINEAAGLPESALKFSITQNVLSAVGADSFFGKVAEWAIANGKELHMVDSSFNHFENVLLEESKKDALRSEEEFGNCRPRESYEMFRDYVEKTIKSVNQRNELVQGQILRLLELGKDIWKNKKIIVFQGSGHRGTYREFKKANPEIISSRVFGQADATFELVDEIIARASIGKLREDDIRRYYLFTFVLNPANKENPELSKRILRQMTPEEIESAFAELGKIEDNCSHSGDKRFAKEYFKRHVADLAEKLKEEE